MHKIAHQNKVFSVMISIAQCKEFTLMDDKENKRIRINNLLKDYSKNKSSFVLYIDSDNFFKWNDASNKDRDTISDGGIHYTPLGYDKFGDFIYKEIVKFIVNKKTKYENTHLTFGINNEINHITISIENN